MIKSIDRNRKADELTGLLFFLVWPFFSLFYALKNYRASIAKVIIVLLYGQAAYFYYFDFSRDLDVVRHAERLRVISTYDASFITERFTDFLTNETHKPDIFQPIVDFLISRVTTDYRVYFLLLGLILGFTLIKFLNIVHFHYLKNENVYTWVIFVSVLVLIPPYRVAGFRGIIAMLFFLIAAYKAKVEGKKQYNFWILFTFLIHFAYLAVLPFYYLTFLVKKRYIIYILLIIAAFFVKDYVPAFFSAYSEGIEGELGSRVQGYSSQRYIEGFNESRENVLLIIRYQMQYSVALISLMFILLYKKLKNGDEHTREIFAFALSLLILQTLLINLEVVFVRFSIPFFLLSNILFALLLNNKDFKFNGLVKIVFWVLMIFTFVVMARKSIEFTGVEVLMPNFILSFAMDLNSSVLDLIK